MIQILIYIHAALGGITLFTDSVAMVAKKEKPSTRSLD
jgi:hypothetical protein